MGKGKVIHKSHRMAHDSPIPSFSGSRSRSLGYISLTKSSSPDPSINNRSIQGTGSPSLLYPTNDSIEAERSISENGNCENYGRRRRRYNYFSEEEEEEEVDGQRSCSEESARIYDSHSLCYKRLRKQDRISELPDSIILQILSCLPTIDAVKTGVLSKRWAYLWTNVSCLKFSCDRVFNYSNTKRFVEFVNATLFLCSQSTIMKFSAKFQYNDSHASDVDRWIRLMFLVKAKEITLNFKSDGDLEMNPVHDFYMLPQHLYADQSLAKLELCMCSVERLEKISRNSLKSLSIGQIFLSDNWIKVILDGSPLLEFLELYNFCGIQNLRFSNENLRKLVIRDPWDEEDDVMEICAPNLQSLTLSGEILTKKFRLLDVKSLTDCCLDFYGGVSSADEGNYYKPQRNMLKDLLQDLRHVETMNLGPWCVQVLSMLEVKRMPSSESDRKCLILNTSLERGVFHGIANLLKGSHCLETLVINIKEHSSRRLRWIDELIPDGEDYWMSQKRKFVCLLLHLKTVRIHGVTPGYSCSDEFILPLVQFILKNAHVLEKMIIKHQTEDRLIINPLFEMAQKLLGFPRSSSNAVVTF